MSSNRGDGDRGGTASAVWWLATGAVAALVLLAVLIL